MKRNISCLVCGADDWERINTYKHFWLYCNECNSVVVERKKRYFFSLPCFAPIFYLLRIMIGRGLENIFLAKRQVLADESVTYSKYAKNLAEGKLKHWENDLARQLGRLDKVDVDYRNKRILIISGGPGVLAKALSKYSAVTVTEYSLEAVKAMKDHLGLNAVKYDFNVDRIEDIVQGSFDIVYAESCINYCRDLRSFVTNLTKILNDNATVIVSNDIPSIGYMLTWQFHDYIPTNYFQNEALLSLFFQSGKYEILDKFQNKYNSYWYRATLPGWKTKVKRLFVTPFWIIYGCLALMPWKNFNRKWWSNNKFTLLRYSKIV